MKTKEEKIKRQEEYLNFVVKYLGLGTDAYIWICAYGLYSHDIDDIIDDEVPKTYEWNEFILRTFEWAETVYANIYYIKNIDKLRPLVKMASNAYMDSVNMEKSNEAWKQKAADILRTMGNELLLAVIEIEKGYEARRQASLELRELSYKTHHLSDGTPV